MRLVRGAKRAAIVALATWCFSVGAFAEDATAQAPPEEPTAAPAPVLPGLNEAQRKNVIAATVPFGKDEADGFWPLYRDYRRDVGKLESQRAGVVAQYLEIFRTMTGDQAKSIVEDYLRIDEDIAKVKRDYLKKFRKVLPETKVTRVLMIDDKVSVATLAELTAQVPIAVPGAPP